MASNDVFPIPNPVHKERWTNPMTGGPYYYDATKNSWIFEPIEPGDTIGRPPFDPADGNLWVDRETEYLLYIYNQGESFLMADPGWTSLTTLKRPYDYMVIEIETDDSKLTPAPAPFVNYFSTGYMYFNSTDMDLKVWLGETDEYDRPVGDGEWVSITQHSIVGYDVMKTPGSIALLEQRIVELTNEINDIENQIFQITGIPLTITPTVSPATADAFSIQGYYPLYATINAAQSDSNGDGTYHVHNFGGVNYFMPNGLEMGVTMFHGDYQGYTGDTTSTDTTSTDTTSTDSGSTGSTGGSTGYGY
jgi:hypothetical protein